MNARTVISVTIAVLLLLLPGGRPLRVSAQTVVHRLSAPLANEAVGAAVASCAQQGYAETAVVVDTDGVTQALLRGDGAGVHTLDSAHDKAYTSVTFRADTGALLDRAPAIGPLVARLPHRLLSPRRPRRRRRARGLPRRGRRPRRARQDQRSAQVKQRRAPDADAGLCDDAGRP